jgi:AbiV family abortive infection protein
MKQRKQLSRKELQKGASLCRSNAKRYFADAKLLYAKKSYGHAFMLGTLCVEELGKSFILTSIKDGFLPQSEYYLNSLFRDHTHKILYVTLVVLGAPNLPPLLSTRDVKMGSLQMALSLERLRQLSQYVNYDNVWLSPQDAEGRDCFKRLSKDLLLSLPIYLSIGPISKSEHLEYMRKIVNDPKKARELGEMQSALLPFFTRSFKRFGKH